MKKKPWTYWIGILAWISLILFVILFLFLITRIFVSTWSGTFLEGYIPSLDIVEISYILVGVIMLSMFFRLNKVRGLSNSLPKLVFTLLSIPAFLWLYFTYWFLMIYWRFLASVFLPLLSFAVIVGVPFFVIRKLRKRKNALAMELEDQLRELMEQLDLGHINEEEYDRKRKKLLEGYQSNAESTQ